MANLKKREIIILVIAAVAVVLYVVYAYFIVGPVSRKVKASAGTSKIETFASEITAELSRNNISDFDKYVVKRAGIDSGKNPFLKKDLYRAWVEKDNKGNSAADKIIYSGYVDSRKNILAIINGVEYRAGEKLVEEGYILKHITPSKVLIFDKRTGSNLEIPIQE